MNMDLKSLIDKTGAHSGIADAVLMSLARAEVQAAIVAPFKNSAWRVMWRVCRSLPWEAEHLPTEFRQYDNPISINGDRGRWHRNDDGAMIRLPVPLEKKNTQIGDGDTRLYQYWTFRWLPARHWFARWVWLGIRNRASQAADDQGYYIPAEVPIETFEYASDKEKIVVRYCPWNGAAQLQRTKIVGPLHFRFNLGFKLGNLNEIDRVAAVTWVDKGFKVRFGRKFDI
jgi:hypothetical protein